MTPPSQTSAPLDVGTHRQLLIDDRFVACGHGLRRVVNPPEKREIVLRPVPGEGDKMLQVATVLEAHGRLLMYYVTFHPDAPPDVPAHTRFLTRVATSDDGVSWRRPRVGLIDVGAGRDNNIVMAGGMGAVFVDPNATRGCRFWWIGHLNESPWWPDGRGAVYRGGPDKEGGIYLCCSTDGMRWTRLPDPILPFWCDTRNQAFFDARTGRYVAYLRGRLGDGRTRVICRAESERLDAPWPFSPRPERPRGPSGLYGPIEGELPVVLEPDQRDPPNTGLYTPNVHAYPWADDVYAAFPERYRCRDGQRCFGRDDRGRPVNEGPLDVALAVSRDGISWTRFPDPYVRLGQIGAVDGGTVYMGLGLVRRGDALWHYTAVSPHTHHGRHLTLPGADGGIRPSVQRLDGFVSLDAGPEGGELTTPPIRFAGRRLLLNVDCGALGGAWVEVQDAAGRPAPGRAMADAVSVDMNGVREAVWWRDGPDVGGLAGTPVRLRIRLRSAKLYAFEFANDTSADRGSSNLRRSRRTP